MLQSANTFHHLIPTQNQTEKSLVRDTGELSEADVAQKINQSLRPILSKDIVDIISQAPPADRALATKLMARMTQFGNMRGLNALQQNLLNMQSFLGPIYNTQGASLSAVLNYLWYKQTAPGTEDSPFKTKLFKNSEQAISSPERPDAYLQKKRGAFILDQALLERLNDYPQIVRHIQQNNIKLLYPEGWVEGVNPFNQLSKEHLSNQLTTSLTVAKSYQKNHQAITEENLLASAVSASTLDKVRQLGLTNQFMFIRNPETLATGEEDPIQKIEKNLVPQFLNETRLTDILSHYSPEDRQVALELLDRNATVLSPTLISQALKEQHQKILDYAKENNIAPDNIRYFIPQRNKSFTLVLNQYLSVNGIPTSQITEDESALNALPDKGLAVIIDDVAGSGSTVNSTVNQLRKTGYQGNVISAPILSTTLADKTLKKLEEKDTLFYFMPHHVAPLFTESPYYQSLPDRQKRSFLNLMERFGHGETDLCAAFPYMSPDNNNQFFAEKIAPEFTLNRGGCKPAKGSATLKSAT